MSEGVGEAAREDTDEIEVGNPRVGSVELGNPARWMGRKVEAAEEVNPEGKSPWADGADVIDLEDVLLSFAITTDLGTHASMNSSN